MRLLGLLLAAAVVAPAPGLALVTQEECDEHSVLWPSIHDDLRQWARSGITEDLMDRSIKQHSLQTHKNAVAFIIKGGEAYLVNKFQPENVLPHHRFLLMQYLEMVYDLSQTVDLPDVEFNIHSQDAPMVKVDEPQLWKEPPLPLMRYCKRDEFGEMLVPYSHFVSKHYDETLLSRRTQDDLKKIKWTDKQEVLVPGRHSHYMRSFRGKRGQDGEERTNVREYFDKEISHQFPGLGKKMIDVTASVKPIHQLATFKYLLVVDGQACTSRFEQLLPLGSLVFKEESKFINYFERALKPWVHYVPFWRHHPHEVFDVFKWAREHDKEAEEIARRGQEFALKHLTLGARRCYFQKLLFEMSKLLKYEVALERRCKGEGPHGGCYKVEDVMNEPEFKEFRTRAPGRRRKERR